MKKLLIGLMSVFALLPSFADVCACGVCPERQNDFVWENDKFGMRAYGPGEYHRWSGLDVFNKSTAENVCLKWCHRTIKGNFHENRGQGMDNYTMGASRGVGGVAMFADGEWKTFPDWETSKVIHTGDDYLEFELVYPAFSAAGKMTYHITLRRGERFFRNDVSFERMPEDFLVGPGIDLEPGRDHKGSLVEEPGLVSLFEDPKGADGKDGSTMAAIFVSDPTQVTPMTDNLNCRVLAFRGRKSFTYWAGASWSLAGEIAKPAVWHAEVRKAMSAASAEWPKGTDPKEVGLRVIRQFQSTDPEGYQAKGFTGYKYGGGEYVCYSVASLWVNALEYSEIVGDKVLQKELVDLFKPFLPGGAKQDKVTKPRHVDFNIFGSVPLEVYLLTGDETARKMGLRYADDQWEPPRPDDTDCMPKWLKSHYVAPEKQLEYLKDGYSGQTRLWIDDMYMINVLQTQAYRVTKDMSYIRRAAKEMVLYLDKLQLENGLFNHAADVPFRWGRGNGWMAAGMSMILQYLKPGDEHYDRILEGYRRMMTTLLGHQRPSGLWGQLVDVPESWDETSGTLMFAYGFLMGCRHGWLDAAVYAPAARRAYVAVASRLDEYANVPDVCIGTGAKNDRQYYFDRKKINGDPHAQAPLLWCVNALLRDK